MESVYRESIPGEINGLPEYEPAPELPVLAAFAQDDPEAKYAEGRCRDCVRSLHLADELVTYTLKVVNQ